MKELKKDLKDLQENNQDSLLVFLNKEKGVAYKHYLDIVLESDENTKKMLLSRKANILIKRLALIQKHLSSTITNQIKNNWIDIMSNSYMFAKFDFTVMVEDGFYVLNLTKQSKKAFNSI